jgi:sporulation protein YlmC with PRC-barrel domain
MQPPERCSSPVVVNAPGRRRKIMQRRKTMKHAMLIAILGLTLATTAADAGAPVAGTVTLGTTMEVTQAIAVGHWASKFIGAPVYNEQEEKVGSIDDLIITPDRSLSYAILSVGGFLGLGGRLIAIPVDQIRAEKGRLILPGATKEALKNVPEFQYAG